MIKSKVLVGVLSIFILSGLISQDVFARERTKRKRHKKVVSESPLLPAPVGPKKTIAVMDFENKAGAASNFRIGSGMAEMLTTSLVNSGRFIVVERQAIQDVLTEQDFGASGRTAQEAAAKFGKILNAQILVRGAVTEFSQRSSRGGQGFRYKGFSLGMSGGKAHVAVNIRLYDSTTGQILDSQRCEGSASSSGLSFGYSESDWAVGTSTFKSTPLGEATQQAIDNAVYFIIMHMQDVPWQGQIVTVKGSTVYLNCGANSGVKIGDSFNVYRPGEELIDPETGISLGSETTMIGRVQVVEVEDKFSKATVVSGAGFERGSIIRFE
jgi:curli biogenesis system outer membrane secretion channel CsgG